MLEHGCDAGMSIVVLHDSMSNEMMAHALRPRILFKFC